MLVMLAVRSCVLIPRAFSLRTFCSRSTVFGQAGDIFDHHHIKQVMFGVRHHPQELLLEREVGSHGLVEKMYFDYLKILCDYRVKST